MTGFQKGTAMKLIQILVLVGATAAAALAQNASATTQNTGSSTKPGSSAKPIASGTTSGKASAQGAASPKKSGSTAASGVKLIVPKTGSPDNGPAAKAKTQGASAHSSVSHNSNPTAAEKKLIGPQKAPVVTVKPVQKPATNAKGAKAVAKKPGKPSGEPEKSQVKIVPQRPSSETKSGDRAEDTTAAANGRRDPFLSVIRNMPVSAAGPSCSVGKRCLFIPDLELKGIAKDTDGQMMAVVVSNTHRAYFLRENDQVFNGSVQKITSDSVIFREFATDHLGRETAHEVVKKLSRS